MKMRAQCLIALASGSKHNYLHHVDKDQAAMQGADNGSVHCLDLGSGKGGASRWLAKEYGCKITAFNLGERQNAFNLERAKAAGIGHLVETHLGSFNEPLPGDWTDKYDMVRSTHSSAHTHLGFWHYASSCSNLPNFGTPRGRSYGRCCLSNEAPRPVL